MVILRSKEKSRQQQTDHTCSAFSVLVGQWCSVGEQTQEELLPDERTRLEAISEN